MKYTIPPLEIAPTEGFSEDKDIFIRKDFGERLASMIENGDGNLVLALDAQWGEGKTTFIQMWRGYVEHQRENKFKTIYFDAFSNDYQKDPFLTLSSEIYATFKDKQKQKKKIFREKATGVAKALTRGAMKISVNAVTGGLIDGTFLDKSSKEISSLISDQVDCLIADRFESTVKDKRAIQDFKEYLEEMVREQGENSNLVFIIDELDRCRPDFAIDLIEQAKHFFSVRGINFLLVLNREQLEKCIGARYGNESDASRYLQKFIDLWIDLPRKAEKFNDSGVRYFQYAIGRMLEEGEQFRNNLTIRTLNGLIKKYKPSFREIERILSYLAIIQNISRQNEYNGQYQILIAFVCYMRCVSLNLLRQCCSRNVDPEKLLHDLDLDSYDKNSDETELFHLANHLRYDLSPREERKKMQEEGLIPRDPHAFYSDETILNISKWLSDIELGD